MAREPVTVRVKLAIRAPVTVSVTMTGIGAGAGAGLGAGLGEGLGPTEGRSLPQALTSTARTTIQARIFCTNVDERIAEQGPSARKCRTKADTENVWTWLHLSRLLRMRSFGILPTSSRGRRFACVVLFVSCRRRPR